MSDLFKDFQQAVAVTLLAENRLAVIAATGDEVKMSGVVLRRSRRVTRID
jgi:hypothetical protein